MKNQVVRAFDHSPGTFKCQLLSGFEDARITPDVWNELQRTGSGNVVFMTWHWQKTWWKVFGRGKLLLIMATENNNPIAVAPLFADEGMIFFVGSGGSDYLDFIGDISNVNHVKELLAFAANQVNEFLGFRFYHIHESSATIKILKAAAANLSYEFFDEGSLVSPLLSMIDFPENAMQATLKKSLIRHEAWFNRNGGFTVLHLKKINEILPWLHDFFDQHISRWAHTNFPSLFLDGNQQNFYTELSKVADETGWIQFTVLTWQQRAIAFHFGFSYHGSFLWYKPSFDITLAKYSPGEVLIRQLLLKAIADKMHQFDFGLGEEAFKNRFSTSTCLVNTVGLYPASLIKN